MSGKKRAPVELLNFLSFPVRLINPRVKPTESDAEAAGLARRYLDLADKALQKTDEQQATPAGPQVVGHSLRLRLEPADGLPPTDFRIHAGEVEVCVSGTAPAEDRAAQWRRLSAREIADHVRRNTVVARWLQSKLGWRNVLKKCHDPGEISPAA